LLFPNFTYILGWLFDNQEVDDTARHRIVRVHADVCEAATSAWSRRSKAAVVTR